MTTTQQLMTAEDLWKLPDDGQRYELVRGELRTMAPAGFEHADVGSNILVILRQYVRGKGLGTVVGADTGFILARHPDVVRAPDIAFVARSRLRDIGIPRQFFPGAPDLAVEVVSPGDTVDEVEEKVNDFLVNGTKLVWVVNPRRHTVTVYRPGPQVSILQGDEQLSGEDVVPGLVCPVAELFTES